MALSADREVQWREGKEEPVKLYRATKIYNGDYVAKRADGYGVAGSDASGLIFAGISQEQVDNTLGNDGDLSVVVRRPGLHLAVFATAISIANEGDQAFLAGDGKLDVTANVTYKIFAGVITTYVDSTHAWVDTVPAIQQADVATHIADTSAAHSASAISIADAGTFTAQTEVEAALQEIYRHLLTTQGFREIPLTIFRELSSGVIPNAAGNGGLLASDSTPSLTCIADGDALRVAWAAGNADQIAASIMLPPNIDLTKNLVVHLLCSKDGNTNNTVHLDGEAYFGESDTDCFPAASAANLLVQAKGEYTATILAADLPANQTNFNMTLVLMPEAHANDAVYLHGAWLEYTKKLLTV